MAQVITLDAFRALALSMSDKVTVRASKDGFRCEIGQAQLFAESRHPRLWKNLTSCVSFLKQEGIKSVVVDLSQMPKKIVPKPRTAAKKRPAKRKVAAAA